MSDFSKFRGSLGGFNRTDVADYIEKLCLTHAAELKERSRRAEELQTQLEETRAQLRETEADRDRLQDQLQEARDALEAATAPEPEPEEPEEPEESEVAEAPEEAPDYPSLELEAYRRAEATERLAARRAEQLSRQMQEFVAHISQRYAETGEEIAALSEDMRNDLQRLQDSLSDLESLFTETTDHFESVEENW